MKWPQEIEILRKKQRILYGTIRISQQGNLFAKQMAMAIQQPTKVM